MTKTNYVRKNNRKPSIRNYNAALDILAGRTVLAHDRRSATASKIDFRTYRTPKTIVVVPAYGVSNTLLKALTKLATSVTFDEGKGLPRFAFAR